jgi:DNA-directed RNA polymerase specialized sigma54-like protein
MSVAKTRALLKREVKALDFKEIAIESAMSEDELIEFYPENQENYPHPAKAITKVNPKEVEVVDTQTGEVKQKLLLLIYPKFSHLKKWQRQKRKHGLFS